MANETMRKFGYPGGLIKQYEHWAVLLRPQQVTAGALVLAATGDATRFAQLAEPAFRELATAIGDIERVLSALLHYDKINYLMLMMVDRHVHFHVIPRYASQREFAEVVLTDPGWPKQPDLQHHNELTDAQFQELRQTLRREWSA